MSQTTSGRQGGILKGKKHSECDDDGCGIKAVVDGTRKIELEGGEVILSAKAMSDPEVMTVTGTKKEIASKINSDKGYGVAFKEGAKVGSVLKKGGQIPNRTFLGEDGGSGISGKSVFEKAVELEKQGRSNEQIRQETGWFRNPHDKLWRFEISDKDFALNDREIDKIKARILASGNKPEKFTFSDLAKHDVLFKAYPEIKELEIIFVNTPAKSQSSYRDNTITYNFHYELEKESTATGSNNNRIGADGVLGSTISRERRSVIAHELTHYVQIREGHGRGSNAVWEFGKLLKDKQSNGSEVSSSEKADLVLKANALYWSSSGEIEARDVQRRVDMSQEELKQNEPLKTIDYTGEPVVRIGNKMKDGGEVGSDKSETYQKWKGLVNMSASELRRFYESEEGKKAGLKPSEAKTEGIDYGRESARWILKMKETPVKEWTPTMWKWANKQISFISRMSGNKGGLYDDKGNKTRKHTSLLIWGHNPEKYNVGGEVKNSISKPTCYDFIKGSESILNNGYYSDQGLFYLITYNSERGKGASVYQTIGYLLADKLALYLGFSDTTVGIVLLKHYEEARRFDNLTVLKEIKDKPVVVVDRDEIVCHNYDRKKVNLKHNMKKNDCIEFVKNNESVLKNGYYHEFDGIILLTYNSGGKDNLPVHQTVNMHLTHKLQELLKIDQYSAFRIMENHSEKAQRFHDIEDAYSFYGKEVIIADRDRIVCHDIKKFKGGGEVNKETNMDKNTLEIIATKNTLNLSFSNGKFGAGRFGVTSYPKAFEQLKEAKDIVEKQEKIKVTLNPLVMPFGDVMTIKRKIEKYASDAGFTVTAKIIDTDNGVEDIDFGGDSYIYLVSKAFNDKNKQNVVAKELEWEGYYISPVTIGGNEYFQVQSDENKAKGVKRGMGDALESTLESAKKTVEEQIQRLEYNKKREQEIKEQSAIELVGKEVKSKQLAGTKDLVFSSDGLDIYIDKSGLTPIQSGRLNDQLDKKWLDSDRTTYTIRERLAKGYYTGKKENKGGNFNRSYYNSLSSRDAQDEYEKRLDAKKSYDLIQKDNTFIEIPKVIYDALVFDEKPVVADQLSGGKADKKDIYQIAREQNVGLDFAMEQWNKGTAVEMEHTKDKAVAKEIALDHLSESINYYIELEKMEQKLSDTMIAYTDASEAYDGFGTKTVEVTPYKTHRGDNVRKVELPITNQAWQSARYLSGNRSFMLENEFNTHKDTIFTKDGAGKEFYELTYPEFVKSISLYANNVAKTVDVSYDYGTHTEVLPITIEGTDEDVNSEYNRLQLEKFHRNKVREAVESGVSVPEEVIDYYNSDKSLLTERYGVGKPLKQENDKTEMKKTENGLIPVKSIVVNKSRPYSNWDEANKALRWMIDQQVWSNAPYDIEFEDGEAVDGTIDLEPKSFWDGKNEPLTWHLNTFWGNVSKQTPSAIIDKESIDFAKNLTSKYDIGQKTEVKESSEGLKKEISPERMKILQSVMKSMEKEKKTAYHYVYDRLMKVAPDLMSLLEQAEYPSDVYGKSQYRTEDFGGNDAFMYLAVEGLEKDERGRYLLSISHYYKQHGDMMCDPCMTVILDPSLKTVEAYSFKMDGSIGRGIIKLVYGTTRDGKEGVNLKEKKSQNSFLNMWSSNWVKQGHKVEFRPLPEKESEPNYISPEAQAVIQPEWEKMENFLAQKEGKASSRKDENEIKREKYPIVVEWSEGSSDENIGFENLEQLEIWLDQIGFTENPDETYIKNKVWFRGMTSYVRIDLSRSQGDFNPKEQSLIEYLIEHVSKQFDWQSLSEAKTPIVQDANFTYFKGIDANYENQFKLNKAIEEFLDSKSSDYVYGNEEKEFISMYEGYGGLEKQGATGVGLLFEYYTPVKLIEKMWGLAYKYGFSTGKVLEPSVGIGRFLNYTSKSDTVKAYEISPYSAKICRIIHPKADVVQSSFAEHFYKGNVFNPKFEKDFDLVIGNPPYGKMTDLRTYGENSRIGVSISQYEHYFILRGLDCLKSGGLLIYVSTANLATKGYEKIKEKIVEKADLVDCYLLPNTTFKQTKVNTSLIVLRRK